MPRRSESSFRERFLIRNGRRTATLWCAGPFLVLVLGLSGQQLWLSGFLFALGVVGPLAYVASERALRARSRTPPLS